MQQHGERHMQPEISYRTVLPTQFASSVKVNPVLELADRRLCTTIVHHHVHERLVGHLHVNCQRGHGMKLSQCHWSFGRAAGKLPTQTRR